MKQLVKLILDQHVLHLLGIETSNDMQLGADLFSEEHEEFVIFRDGRFVTDELCLCWRGLL